MAVLLAVSSAGRRMYSLDPCGRIDVTAHPYVQPALVTLGLALLLVGGAMIGMSLRRAKDSNDMILMLLAGLLLLGNAFAYSVSLPAVVQFS